MTGHRTLVTCLITDGTLSAENFEKKKGVLLSKIRTAADAGVSLVQIREKDITAGMLFELSRGAVDVVHGSDTLIFINDRADVAAAAGANGVHLTSTSLGADEIRRVFCKRLMIGVSTHSALEVFRARDNGADFAVFGPVFPTPGKGEPIGVEMLATVCKSAGEFPVLALGGISRDNWPLALSAGAAGFAAIRFFEDFNDAAELADALRK